DFSDVARGRRSARQGAWRGRLRDEAGARRSAAIDGRSAYSRRSAADRLGATPEFAALDLAGDFLQPVFQRRIDAFHLQPDFRHHGLASANLRAAYALAAQHEEARARRFFGAEYAERQRPVVGAFVDDDEVVLDAERFQLGRLAQRRLA